MSEKTPVSKVLQKILSATQLKRADYIELRDLKIKDATDAKALCDALRQTFEMQDADKRNSLQTMLLHVIYNIEAEDAAELMRQEGPPIIRAILDAELRSGVKKEQIHQLVEMIRLLLLLHDRETLERLPELIQDAELSDSFLWTKVFEDFLAVETRIAVHAARSMANPLPRGFAGVAYLDFANELCRRGNLDSHPFDNAEGIRLLENYLAKQDEESSHAVSAAMALAFIAPEARERLFSTVRSHPVLDVQMEAAWADGHIKGSWGVEFLAKQAEDPRQSEKACDYLEMLGRAERIPAVTRDENFQATAQMCAWLAHPMEAGAPPDEIEMMDTREIYWPPLKKQIRVWAFRFRYVNDEDGVGYGMVGSTTFSLSGDYPKNATAEDVYAMHCGWELEKEPYLKEGRKALKINAKS